MTSTPLGLVLRQLRKLEAARTASQQSDQELLHCFVTQRDEVAFETLLRRHGPMVLHVCYRVLRHAQDAEDAFQATFLALARQAASIRKPQAVGSWLHGVAYRVAGQLKAAAARRGLCEPEEREMPAMDPVAEVTWRELRGLLDEELQGLPQRYREPLVLCYLEGRTQDEAAQQLGWSKSTLRRRLEHGRELLRHRLSRRGLTLSAVLCATVLTQARAPAAVATLLGQVTVRAALGLASGQSAVATGISAQVATLAEGVSKSMLLIKLQLVAVVVFTMTMVGVGGALLCHTRTTEPTDTKQERTPRAVTADPKRLLASQNPDPTALRPQFVAQSGHEATVSSVVFSPDGKTMASGCFNGLVRLWETRTGELRQVLGCDASRLVNCVAFSPDGELLASAGIHVDQTVKLWEVRTGKLVRTLAGHDHREVNALAFSPDGQRLASACNDETVKVWDLKTGAVPRTLRGHRGAATALAFSPNGKALASGGADQAVRLWEATTGKLQRILEGHTDRVNAVAFSPDGSLLASGSSDTLRNGRHDLVRPGEVRLWDAGTGELQRTITERERVMGLAFSPDGRTLVGGIGRWVVLYEVRTAPPGEARPARRLWAHNDDVLSVAFAPDGATIASGSFDRTVDVVDVRSGLLKRRLPGVWDQITSLTVSPDGRTLASASADIHFSQRFDEGDFRFAERLRTCFSRAVGATKPSPGEVRLWDMSTGRLKGTLAVANEQVTSVAFSQDGQTLASGAWDLGGAGVVRLWDVQTRKPVQQLTGHRAEVLCVEFSPDGKTLASGSADQNVQLWDVPTGVLRRTLIGHQGKVNAVTFSPDGQTLVSGSADRTVKFWDVPSGSLKKTLPASEHPVEAVAFSPTGKLLATGSRKPMVKLWDVATGQLQRSLQGDAESTSFVAFSPDGKLLACHGRGKNLDLWEVETGKLQRELVGHIHGLNAAVFSPDGKMLVSGAEDRTVKLWAPDPGQLLATLLILPATREDEISHEWIAFTPEGYYEGSGQVAQRMHWRAGQELLSSERSASTYHRPDLLRRALRQGR